MPRYHCSWSSFIEKRLVNQHGLMLVANMRQSHRLKLRTAGIIKIVAFAALPDRPAFPGLNPDLR
jgi:hypothetical protein